MSREQVWEQSAPVLKAAVLGLWGVSTRSWSIHWPQSTSMWDRVESTEMLSLWVNSTSCDTSRTWKTNKDKECQWYQQPTVGCLRAEWSSYWRQADVVVGVVGFPASRYPPHVFILWMQPTRICDVCRSPSRMLSEQNKIKFYLTVGKKWNLVTAALFCYWPVVALACDGPVALRQTVSLTGGGLQLSRAARHLQQILHVSITQQLWR